MKRNFFKLSAIIFSLVVVSCSKESTTPSGGADITGNYRFISLHAKTTTTEQTASGSNVLKTVSTSDYTSQNNSGTVTIDAGKFTSNSIAYSINTVANVTVYDNGISSGTYPIPFQLNIPASSGSATYKRVSADSIYFVSGTLFIDDNLQTARPAGARIKVENDKLTLTSNILETTTSTAQNITVTQTAQATTVVTLQKQ